MKNIIGAAICACILMASACTGKPEKASSARSTPPPREAVFIGGTPEDQVKNTIMRYNQLLVFGYDKLNMNPIQEVAELRLAEKAYYHMAAIGEGGVRMTSQMKKIDFEKVAFPSPGKAEVKTREIWDFAYNDIKTGDKKEEVKDFVYLVDYHLEQRPGGWILTDITAGGEQKPEGKKPAGAAPSGSRHY